MEGPRSPTENEFDLVMDFLDSRLRPQTEWSIAQEYPTALTKTNLHNMRIITDESRILSHAVLKPLIVKTPHVVLKVGAIGSVVTDESARGQGLSTKILASCLEEAQKQECDIAVLWTDLHDFYRRLGFELAGFEQSYLIDKPLAASGPALTCKATNQVDPAAIHRLMQKRSVGAHRTPEDVKRFLQIPNSKLYTAWAADGRLEAFAVEGKGADLRDYLHEWSGSVSGLLHLFNFILQSKGTAFTLITPRHSQALNSALEERGAFRHEGYLGMIKIINKPALIEKVSRAFAALGDTLPPITALDDSSLTRFLFGPNDDLLAPHFASHPRCQDILPLRFWLWGWDSI